MRACARLRGQERPPLWYQYVEVEEQYIETPVGSLASHKFVKLTEVNPEFAELPKIDILDDPFNYTLEVYMED